MQRPAWHLALSDGHNIAISQNQVVEYLSNQTSVIIPDCQDFCNQMIIWRQRILPVLGNSASNNNQHSHILIIHFSSVSEQKTIMMALSLISPPSLISVDDEDACQPDKALSQHWRHAILSCFNQNGKATPIIDFHHLNMAGRPAHS